MASGLTSTLRSSRRRPPSSISQAGTSSRRLWLPYRVSPAHHRKGRVATRWLTPLAPSEVSSPSAFASRKEPHSPGGSQPAGYVASSGFLALSTPCSPCDLLGLFHPRCALGVRSSRLSSPTGAVRPLERRDPPGLPPRLANHGAPFRGSHASRSSDTRPGYWPGDWPACLLELLRSEVSCQRQSAAIGKQLPSPPALLRHFRKLKVPPALQGRHCQRRSRSLSRSA